MSAPSQKNQRWTISAIAFAGLAFVFLVAYLSGPPSRWNDSAIYPILIMVGILALTISAFLVVDQRAPLSFMSFVIGLLFFLFLTTFNGITAMGNDEFSPLLFFVWLFIFALLICSLVSSWNSTSTSTTPVPGDPVSTI